MESCKLETLKGHVVIRVIASLSPGWWRVIVGPGVGTLDGGIEQDWPEAYVPIAARRPNAEFHISGIVDGVPQIICWQNPESDDLPPHIQRFAPWRWHWMDRIGIGLTIGTVITALSAVLWYFTR